MVDYRLLHLVTEVHQLETSYISRIRAADGR